MHELSLCRSLLNQVINIAVQQHAGSIKTIHLRIGPLSGVETGLLVHAFSITSRETLAAHARLVVVRTPVRVRCQRCYAEADVKLNHLLCPYCGNWRTQLISGDEMILESVELSSAETNEQVHSISR